MEQLIEQLTRLLISNKATGPWLPRRLGRGAELATVSGGPGGCRPSPSGPDASRGGSKPMVSPHRRGELRRAGESGAERSGERWDSVAVTMRSWRDVAVAGRAGPRRSLTSSYVNVPELNLWFLQWLLISLLSPIYHRYNCRPEVVLP